MVRPHRTPGLPGLNNLGLNQGPGPLGPHGGDSRIEPGSPPGTHFSLLHSPGLLSVGAFLLLLPLAVPHNLAPPVTLSRTSSSLPTVPTRSPSIPTAPNSIVTVVRSDPDASCQHTVPKRLDHRDSVKQCRIARAGDAKPKPHSPVRLPTPTRSPSSSPSLRSIQFITAKPQLPRTRTCWKASRSSLLSDYPTKKRSPCYRNALHPPPPPFHTTLQSKAPTAGNRTSSRFWLHWRLPFSPRLDGAGPVLRPSPIC